MRSAGRAARKRGLAAGPGGHVAGVRIVVLGQIARDLVLVVDRVPDAGAAAGVRRRDELLGGKGANQAVALRQLGDDVALLGVVGDDDAGEAVLAQATADGIDVSAVRRRPDAQTALLVDVVEPGRSRRLLEHVPAGVLLSPADVRAAAPLLRGADALVLQLQQPGEAVREALLGPLRPGCLIVADGAPPDEETRRALCGRATVVRADAGEARAWTDAPVRDAAEALHAARRLLREGPEVVALAAQTGVDVVAWGAGHVVLPHGDEPVIDATGGGDAFVAGLTSALGRGLGPATAGRWATLAASATVGTAGGRARLALRHAPGGPVPARAADGA